MLSAYYINEALTEAKKADPALVRPNPLVGAILVDGSGKIVGRGYHQQYGGPHAEVNAFNDAIGRGAKIDECTLYVTLEPCSHHGKTPPCTNLILQHGVKRVVVGSLDPNPVVHGIELLQNSGVEVEIIDDVAINDLNRVFFVNQREKRPYFQFKLAFTTCGVYAAKQQRRFWISGSSSIEYVHKILRSDVDAIMSTAASVLNDNSKLNVRLQGHESEKTAIIIDPNLDLLASHNTVSAIFYPRKNSKIILVTTVIQQNLTLPLHVELLHLPTNGLPTEVDLSALAMSLYQKGYFKILVEAGGSLYKRLSTIQFIDECQFIVANKTLEQADTYLKFPPAANILSDNYLEGFTFSQKKPLGEDALYQFFRK